MKKLVIILSIFSIFLTGCSIQRINDKNIDEIIDNILKKDTKLKNVSFEGYSYYTPKGLIFLEKNEYNATLKDQYQNYYYLYIDVVSKYHNIKEDYKVDWSSFYSKKIKNNKKYGYFEINKVDNQYFIEAMYYYMKIETYVKEENLEEACINISTILSSIHYNNKVLDTIVGENILDYKEENYNIFKTKKNTTDFLDYVKEFDTIEENDEDEIKIEEGE